MKGRCDNILFRMPNEMLSLILDHTGCADYLALSMTCKRSTGYVDSPKTQTQLNGRQ